MNSKSFSTQFLQTIGAYGCAVSLGLYFSATYSHIAVKAVFLLIPVLTLAVARIRTRPGHQVLQFDRETSSDTPGVKVDDNFEPYSRHCDLVSQAS